MIECAALDALHAPDALVIIPVLAPVKGGRQPCVSIVALLIRTPEAHVHFALVEQGKLVGMYAIRHARVHAHGLHEPHHVHGKWFDGNDIVALRG